MIFAVRVTFLFSAPRFRLPSEAFTASSDDVHSIFPPNTVSVGRVRFFLILFGFSPESLSNVSSSAALCTAYTSVYSVGEDISFGVVSTPFSSVYGYTLAPSAERENRALPSVMSLTYSVTSNTALQFESKTDVTLYFETKSESFFALS